MELIDIAQTFTTVLLPFGGIRRKKWMDVGIPPREQLVNGFWNFVWFSINSNFIYPPTATPWWSFCCRVGRYDQRRVSSLIRIPTQIAPFSHMDVCRSSSSVVALLKLKSATFSGDPPSSDSAGQALNIDSSRAPRIRSKVELWWNGANNFTVVASVCVSPESSVYLNHKWIGISISLVFLILFYVTLNICC